MNRIYRLVWNRALRVLQVASEITRSSGGDGGNGNPSLPRRHPLALACAAMLGLTAFALPAWSASCTIDGVTYASCTTGTAGGGGGAVGSTAGNVGGTGSDPGNNDGGKGGNAGQSGQSGQGQAPGAGGSVGTGGGGGGGGELSSSGKGSGGGGGGGSGGGGGGGGGLGYTVSQPGTTFALDNAVIGGAGGNGGGGGSSGGGGGGGGSGVWLATDSTLTNHGGIAGGAGGDGGTHGFGGGMGGDGGGGGAGLLMDTNTELHNTGHIIGGAGGSGNTDGTGGVGVVSHGNATVVNAGSIAGGLSGDGVTRADAVHFSGGGNTLVLESGFSFTGNVVSDSGNTNGGDTLGLGGDSDGTFDVSAVGSQYQGFTGYEKTGTGTWTLTDTTQAVTPWTIKQGTLSVSSDASLGAASGGLTFDGGTLATMSTFTIGYKRHMTLNAGGGTFRVDSNQLTVDGGISGTGTLTKTGDGTLTLTGDNSYGGGTLIKDGGIISVAQGSNLGASSGVLTLDDGTLRNTDTFSIMRDVVLGQGGGTFKTDANLTISGVISSGTQSAGLTKTGSGTLKVTGDSNTYAGGTFVQGGKLELAAGGTLGSGSAAVSVSKSTLKIDVGASLDHHVELLDGSLLENHGALANTTATSQGQVVYGSGSASVQNFDGGTITGTQVAVDLGAGGEVGNFGDIAATGNGGVGIRIENVRGTILNANGGTISGGRTAIVMSSGGRITNAQVSTIKSDGTVAIDTRGAGATLENSGDILGWVQMDEDAVNHVTLVEGSTIKGILRLGSNTASTLTLTGDDTLVGHTLQTQLYSKAVQGDTQGFTGTLHKDGSGTWVIDNDRLSGVGNTVIDSGRLQIGNGGTTGTIGDGAITNNDRLRVNRSDALTLNNVISGIGSLYQVGNGTLTLGGVNTYTGETWVLSGTLSVSQDANLGDAEGHLFLSGGTLETTAAFTTGRQIGVKTGGATLRTGDDLTLSDGGSLTIDGTLTRTGTGTLTIDGTLAGAGRLVQQGAGTLVLNGDGSGFGGSTQVSQGTLIVGGTAHPDAVLAGNVSVGDGKAMDATLGGSGTIAGDVTIKSGDALSPGNAAGSIGMLTINGNLFMHAGSHLRFDFGMPGADFQTAGISDHVSVGGALDLDGAVLHVNDIGGMGPGLYNLIDYGSLTKGNVSVASGTPEGVTLWVNQADNQIDLYNTQGLALNVWAPVGEPQNGTVTPLGGSGTWSASAPNWTDQTHTRGPAPMTQDSFVIFQGASGTVTLDTGSPGGPIAVSGMQFAVGGYVVEGKTSNDTLQLHGTTDNNAVIHAPIIRVGNGDSDDDTRTARLDVAVLSHDGLVKQDAGTLVMDGTGTRITVDGDGSDTQTHANVAGIILAGGILQLGNADASDGEVEGGNGVAGTDATATAPGTAGGTGGAGVAMTTGTTLTNYWALDGGDGGAGGVGDGKYAPSGTSDGTYQPGGASGAGGAGIDASAGLATIANHGYIQGGYGGGYIGNQSGSGKYGAGGEGGAGVALGSGSNLTSDGAIYGGAGGFGAIQLGSPTGGTSGAAHAGAGGAGIDAGAGHARLTLADGGYVVGGNGGMGGIYAAGVTTTSGSIGAGTSGTGGAGIVLGDDASLTSTGAMIRGGEGGVGMPSGLLLGGSGALSVPSGYSVGLQSGNGGAGGTGVHLAGPGAYFANNGAVYGGNGYKYQASASGGAIHASVAVADGASLDAVAGTGGAGGTGVAVGSGAGLLNAQAGGNSPAGSIVGGNGGNAGGTYDAAHAGGGMGPFGGGYNYLAVIGAFDSDATLGGGTGGAGGVGVEVASAGGLVNQSGASIAGGMGGIGSDAGLVVWQTEDAGGNYTTTDVGSGTPGAGGAGGAGVTLADHPSLALNAGRIVGGDGGQGGGYGYSKNIPSTTSDTVWHPMGDAAAGGAGGAAVQAGAGVFSNSGSITGGDGGMGGSVASVDPQSGHQEPVAGGAGGGGGAGGAGVASTGALALTDSGYFIKGGNGGDGGLGGFGEGERNGSTTVTAGGAGGDGGAGGAGVDLGDGASLASTGSTIKGGYGGQGGIGGAGGFYHGAVLPPPELVADAEGAGGNSSASSVPALKPAGTGGAGGAGGTGARLGSGATFSNDAAGGIFGGAGGQGGTAISENGPVGATGAGGAGGMGGTALVLGANAISASNAGTLRGGAGGDAGAGAQYGNPGYFNAGQGYAGFAGYAGAVGGTGGIGASLASGTSFTNTMTADIHGGHGGAGGSGGQGGYGGRVGGGPVTATSAGGIGGVGGLGGDGGAGLVATATAQAGSVLNNHGVIFGGLGGQGGQGGQGGYGYVLNDGGSASKVVGAAGGAGATGGAGGSGVSLASNIDFANGDYGYISGGQGGTGGKGGNGKYISGIFPDADGGAGGHGGAGGAGGIGASLGRDVSFTNAGSVMGGRGGTGGTGGWGNSADTDGADGLAGAGGVGLLATGGDSIVNAGTIAGGMSGDGAIQADAVRLSGGGNTLTLEKGYTFVGHVISTSGTVNDVDTLALSGSDDATFDVSAIVPDAPTAYAGSTQYHGFGRYEKTGSSTWTLTGATQTVTPWTIRAGTLSVSGDANLGATGGTLTFAGGTLENTAAFTTARNVVLQANGNFQTDADLTITGTITGNGNRNLVKTGSATLILTGANTYRGGTTIAAGTLQVGDGGTKGSIVGDVVNHGTLAFDRSDAVTFAGVVSGSGALVQQGAGTLTLDGASGAFAGHTQVQSGGLIVGSAAGNDAALGGNVTVAGGALLGGHGTVGGDVTLAAGAHLAPGASIGTLTIGGDLDVAQGGVLDFEFGAPGTGFATFGNGDHVHVDGNLALEGATLDVVDAGGMGPGLYNLFTYGGTLTENNGGLLLGTTPAGADLRIRTLTARKQINLIDLTGITLNVWNADGQGDATHMGGGDGTWSATSAVWTDATGTAPNASMQPQPGFALFGGNAGTVNVDNGDGAVTTTGMQFAVDGYTLTGDIVTLVKDADGNPPVIRVGDGSAAGADMLATIEAVLAGSAGLTKTDAGTLVLAGANTFTGGVTIHGGTLSVSSDARLGDASNTLTLDGGLLEVTGTTFTTTDRDIVLGHAGGGFAIDAAANTFTLAASMGGQGALVKDGAGTLVLTGANTYAGGTTIADGTLRIGAGDTTGSVAGDVVNHGTLAFDRSDAITFDGIVSGTGALIQQGSGTLTLGGTNTYTGGTTVAAGTLAVGDAAALGTGAVALADGTTLAFAADGLALGNAFTLTGTPVFRVGAGQTGTLGGVLADGTVPGTLEKGGTGTLVLTGANAWSGGTTIAAGTLQVGAGGTTGSIVGDVVNHGTLAFDRGDDVTFDGVVSGTGSLVQAGTGTLTLSGANTYTGGTTVAAGTLVGNTTSLHGTIADEGTLVFAQAGTGTFHGTLSGDGTLAKTGAGELILNGDNVAFTGNTTVQAGALIVGDDGFPDAVLGGTVRVARGALLGGFGTVGGIDLSGTLATGHSLGTLHVAGDVTFRPGSTWQVEISPDGQSDQLDVAGQVTLLGGSALALAAPGDWQPRTDYTLLTAQGGLSGRFDTVNANLAFLTPTLAYGAHDVTLSLQRNDVGFADVGVTRNQRATAGAAEDLGWGNTIYDALVRLNAMQARAAFDQLSGEWYASMPTARLHDSRYVREAMDQRLTRADTDRDDAHAARLGDSAGTFWFHGWGQWGDRDGDGNAARMQANGSGLLVGVDAALGGQARVGGVLGTSQSSLRVDRRASDGHDKATWVGIYGSLATGPLRWRAGLAYAREQLDSHRRLAVPGLVGHVGADLDGRTGQAWVEATLPHVTAHGRVAPFLHLAHVRVHTDGWREGGGAVALQGSGSDTRASLATLGVRGAWNLGNANHPVRLHGRIGWRQAFGADTPEARMTLGGSAPFTVYGLPLAKHAVAVQAGLDFAVSERVRFDVGYSGQFAGDARDQGARMSLEIAF